MVGSYFQDIAAKKIFDYHHFPAKKDNIAKAETTDHLLLYLNLN